MAVFMINICKYNGCGITFPKLTDLIEHIEDVHIDYDPAVVEQKEASQPACIPLSYVLKFISEASRREIQSMPPIPDIRRRILSIPKTPSVRSSTPTGSEMDDEDLMSPSEDSNDSWTTVEEYSSEFILRHSGVRSNNAMAMTVNAQDKPFACPVPGCKKRYKNVNGIKYHSKNGHKKDGKVKKAYKCHCGKSYKTPQGLKNHSITYHSPNLPSVPASTPDIPRINIPKMPGLVVTASPARSMNIVEAIDGNKLVRFYDTIKTKDLPTFTIPKHNITNINIVNASQSLRHSGILTPNSTPNSSPLSKLKLERTPKVTVQSTQPLTPLTPSYGDLMRNA